MNQNKITRTKSNFFLQGLKQKKTFTRANKTIFNPENYVFNNTKNIGGIQGERLVSTIRFIIKFN